MGKLNQLKGVAHTLANSFVSVTNIEFLNYIKSLPLEKIKSFKIDLLGETILPEKLNSEIVKGIIPKYKKWFLLQMKKMKIELSDINKVSVKLDYHPDKVSGEHVLYICNVTINAKGKDYTGKMLSFYSS